MNAKTIRLDNKVRDYMLSVSLHEHAVLQAIREFTQTLPNAQFMLAEEQAQFLGWLIKALNVKRALELGTYTGYSSTAMALALPQDGHLICCDSSVEFTEHAKRFWREAKVDNKITLHCAPAVETLKKFVTDKVEPFDFIFIDADKPNYIAYYELSLQLLEPKGVIVVDNTLWKGYVADPANQDNTTRAIRKFNQHVYQDPRVDISIIPTGDGMTLIKQK